jgi:hypothetical protein
MDQVTLIKQAVSDWNQDRSDLSKSKALLENGAFFTITRSEFDKWNTLVTKPEEIHAYPAVINNELKFVLIDSQTDKNTFDNKALPFTFVKDYTRDYGINDFDFLINPSQGNISVDEAMKRIVRWNVMLKPWLKDQITRTTGLLEGLFRVFNIPFNDLNNSFENKSVSELIVNLALKPTENPTPTDPAYTAELILWSTSATKGQGGLPVQDLVGPCPPFGQNPGEDYHVLTP